MRQAIWKFPLEVMFAQEVEMPPGAFPLCVQMQHGVPCIWAQVESYIDRDMVRHQVHMIPTGAKFDHRDIGSYLGTIQLDDKDEVYHVFLRPW